MIALLRGLGKARKWPLALLATIGLLGVTGWLWLPAVMQGVARFVQADLGVKDNISSVVSMIVGALSMLISTVLGWLQLRRPERKAESDVSARGRREQDVESRPIAHVRGRAKLPRMDTVNALALRVHPAIGLSSDVLSANKCELDVDLPTFVKRDQSASLGRILQNARRSGGFVVLVGDSSVGKTRLLYEAAREILFDFAVLVPDLGDGGIVNALTEDHIDPPGLIVWLDELQRFLPGPYLAAGHTPITASTLRRLLDSSTPVVMLGTLWPEYSKQLRAADLDPVSGLYRPRYQAAMDLLDDRRLHELPLNSFSQSERAAAARLAAMDPRLVEAIANQDYNVTEVLAGAREVVRRYERGTKVQQAILHSAVDARRIGIQDALSKDLLSAAARGYLANHYPDDAQFQQAIDELSTADRPQDRAAAPLIAITSVDRKEVLGFTVADYLQQRLVRQRRGYRLPVVAWQALLAHVDDVDDRLRLADSAIEYRMFDYAESLCWQVIESGVDDWRISVRLVNLLALRRDAPKLRARADAGDLFALDKLTALLVGDGELDEAIKVLSGYGELGDKYAFYKLAYLLDDCGRRAEAIDVWRLRAQAGDGYAFRKLLQLLIEDGQSENALLELEHRGDAGDWLKAFGMAALLKGRAEEVTSD